MENIKTDELLKRAEMPFLAKALDDTSKITNRGIMCALVQDVVSAKVNSAFIELEQSNLKAQQVAISKTLDQLEADFQMLRDEQTQIAKSVEKKKKIFKILLDDYYARHPSEKTDDSMYSLLDSNE